MNCDARFESIIDGAIEGRGPTREECVYLLGFEPHSVESTHMMSLANAISRRRTSNSGVIYAQLGIDVAPCRADCLFCAFGESHFAVQRRRMAMEEVSAAVHSLSDAGDLFGIFLMTMHVFDLEHVLDAVQTARAALPPYTQIWVNVGDLSARKARRLKDAGVQGAYHVLRLREGEDTRLDPKKRLATFDVIKEAGLNLFTCCEPIGPEHTPQELVDRIFLGFEQDCMQQSAMRRVVVPGLPIASRGQISHLRLAQIVAVITLASISYPSVQVIACHEPNLLALTAGSNVVAAEYGANPRDAVVNTAENRGLSMNDCRRMLFEAGFTAIVTGRLEQIPLDVGYLRKVGAM